MEKTKHKPTAPGYYWAYGDLYENGQPQFYNVIVQLVDNKPTFRVNGRYLSRQELGLLTDWEICPTPTKP